MLNKYEEMTQPCRTPFLTGNHSDSVPATLTLVWLGSQSSAEDIPCYRELIMRDRVECLLEVHEARIKWLLTLACLLHQYSEIRDLVSSLPTLSESCLLVCNFSFGLHSDPCQYDLKKDLACMGNQSNCSVVYTLFKITFIRKWDECGERPFLCSLTSFPDRHTYSVHPVQCSLSAGFEQFCWDVIRTCGFATCRLTDRTSNL